MAPRGVCRRCARRGWLLSRLGDELDALADDPERFWPALELDDGSLIAALAGSRRGELLEKLEAWSSSNRVWAQRGVFDGMVGVSCRHHCRYPERMRDDPLAPAVLAMRGDGREAERWEASRVVAIAGARSPSEYGIDIARSFAAELTAAGVTVAGGVGGLSAIAVAAAREAGGSALSVVTGASAEERACVDGEQMTGLLAERVDDDGDGDRCWQALAAERTLALLADLVLVVQAHEDDRFDLACVEVARSRGVPVAAVPGPVDSPACRGSNRLLASGARIVCSAAEALDALFGVGGEPCTPPHAGSSPGGRGRGGRGRRGGGPTRSRRRRARPDPDQLSIGEGSLAVLDLLGAGERTLGEIGRELVNADGAAVAVTELELAGLAVRGDDGRYRAARAEHRR